MHIRLGKQASLPEQNDMSRLSLILELQPALAKANHLFDFSPDYFFETVQHLLSCAYKSYKRLEHVGSDWLCFAEF